MGPILSNICIGGIEMNRMIILESLLALAAVAILGPGATLLVREAAWQAVALIRASSRRGVS